MDPQEHKFDQFGCIINPSLLTLEDNFLKATELGISTFQIVLGEESATSTERRFFSKEDIEKVKTQYPTFKCFSHLPMGFNLVGTKKIGLFDIDPSLPAPKRFRTPYAYRMAKAIEYELSITKELGGGCVIHPGSYIELPEKSKEENIDEALKAIVRFIDSITYPPNSKLILENDDGACHKVSSLKNLNWIYQNCKVKEHIFFCIDACHIFASGEYDISKCSEIDRLYGDIQQMMRIEKIALIHLNDSKTEFGSHKDRHAFSCQGFIWKDNFISFVYFLTKFDGIPLICETSMEDVFEIRKMVYD
jgi:endonuclease IV